MPIFSGPSVDSAISDALRKDKDVAPYGAKEQRVGPWPYLAPIAANGADLWTSLYDEMKKGTHEANAAIGDGALPLIATKAGVTALDLALVHSLAKDHPNWAKFLGYASAVPPALAAIHNARIK